MSFGDFEQNALAEFINTERAPDVLWIFVHVPKTAGSSFASELAGMRCPYRNIHIDYSDQTRSHAGKMDEAVARFVEESRVTEFKSCSGHIDMDHVEQIRAIHPAAKVITFLRNPLARVVSDFRYARTPAHPPYRDFIRLYPTILDYILAPESQNKMARILCGSKFRTVTDVPAVIADSLAFAGLVEMYPMSFNIISQLFGENTMPTEYKRKTESVAENQIELDGFLKREIMKANELDFAVYDYVRERLAKKREEWAAFRSRRSA